MASRPETSAPSRSCCHPVWFRRRVRRQLFLVAKDREDALWDNVAAFIPGSRQIVRNLVGFDRLVQPVSPTACPLVVSASAAGSLMKHSNHGKRMTSERDWDRGATDPEISERSTLKCHTQDI